MNFTSTLVKSHQTCLISVINNLYFRQGSLFLNNNRWQHARFLATSSSGDSRPGAKHQTIEISTNKLISGRTKARSIMELMRWHKPTGTILTLTPAMWSLGLATPDISVIPDLKTMAIFTAGAIVARGLGCTLNDILDRRYDRLVERTKLRPIACGDITVKEALAYLALQSSVGLFILCLNNIHVIKLGLFSGLMIATYPLFKRFTDWPQVMLALTFNWGVIMGYSAIRGPIDLYGLAIIAPTYLGANFWTLYYDTIYAHQDKTDDMFIGVKSSALRLGAETKKFLYYMSGGMFLSLSTSGLITNQMWPYYMSVTLAGVYHMIQVKQLDLDNKTQCWNSFDQQKYIGVLILLGVLVSVAMKSRSIRKDEYKCSPT